MENVHSFRSFFQLFLSWHTIKRNRPKVQVVRNRNFFVKTVLISVPVLCAAIILDYRIN